MTLTAQLFLGGGASISTQQLSYSRETRDSGAWARGHSHDRGHSHGTHRYRYRHRYRTGTGHSTYSHICTIMSYSCRSVPSRNFFQGAVHVLPMLIYRLASRVFLWHLHLAVYMRARHHSALFVCQHLFGLSRPHMDMLSRYRSQCSHPNNTD